MYFIRGKLCCFDPACEYFCITRKDSRVTLMTPPWYVHAFKLVISTFYKKEIVNSLSTINSDLTIYWYIHLLSFEEK